jgi:hypothetical protein
LVDLLPVIFLVVGCSWQSFALLSISSRSGLLFFLQYANSIYHFSLSTAFSPAYDDACITHSFPSCDAILYSAATRPTQSADSTIHRIVPPTCTFVSFFTIILHLITHFLAPAARRIGHVERKWPECG